MSSALSPEAAQRRHDLAPGTSVGVDEAMIHTLVHAFYARVRAHPVLGPIFNGAIQDWDSHLAKLCDFWSSVTLMTGRFKGQPMAVHARLPGIEPEHFAIWLGLFGETARKVCPSEAAALFEAKAAMIGQSLQLGLEVSRGRLPPVHKTP